MSPRITKEAPVPSANLQISSVGSTLPKKAIEIN